MAEPQQIGPAGFVYDAETGEVVADAQQVRAMAEDLEAVERAIEEAEGEAARLRQRRGDLEHDLRALVPKGASIDLGPEVSVVRVEAPRPSQRVSKSGCDRYVEQLLALDMGEREFKPPGIAEVRRRAPELVAAGIPVDVIAPEPARGPDRIVVVRKPARASS